MILFDILLSSFIIVPGVFAILDPGYNCQPGQKCWPSWQDWQDLNQSVDGLLHQTIPMGGACYQNSAYYDEAECGFVETNYNDSISRGSYFGQTYWINWEACGSSSCSLESLNPQEKLYSTCSLGRLASYYVDVRNASHISETLQFAKSHNLRISIKNTGHDFFGRSSVPNSLSIWTHNLDSFDFHQNFTASDCPAANGQNIGEMGAGVVSGDAYRFFNSRGMDVTGGYEQSVGIAGGFGQGGGVGAYTTSYGLMVDNAVEFEVVTADGEIRIINQCNDPELFWAMRGGGGGTYAVLTKYRLQVYPSVPFHTLTLIATYNTTDNGTSKTQNKALREILQAHASSQIEWSENRVTGQVEYFPQKVSVGLVLPYNDDGSTLKNATASFVASLSILSNIQITQNDYATYATYSDYLSVAAADARQTEPAGIFSLLASRLIPRSVFGSIEGRDALVEGVIEGVIKARSLLNLTGTQVVLETPVNNPDSKRSTSALPAWRDALWHVIHVGEWETPLETATLKDVTGSFLKMLDPLKKLSPNGGAYFNEAHYEEPDWQGTFFGSNYGKLLEIKEKYDPTHIFDCWKCVGWRGEQDPYYSCYKN